jgi:hypothetical protein
MSISTRLSCSNGRCNRWLSVTSYSSLRRREAGLNQAMRSEVVAHAHTLQIALRSSSKAADLPTRSIR